MDIRILNQAGDRLVNLIDKDISIVKIGPNWVIVAIKDDKSVELAKFESKGEAKEVFDCLISQVSLEDVIINMDDVIYKVDHTVEDKLENFYRM